MTAATRSSSFALDLRKLFSSSEIGIAIVIIVIVGMMIVPLPVFALDMFIVLNLGISFGIILLSI